MSKQNNISIQGTVSNLLDEGFDMISSIKEITDNSFGAVAKNIRFFIDMKTLTIFVMDDGTGMNKQQLTKLATLNDRKEISRLKQGKYGQGVKLSFAFLTQNNHSVTIISKTKDHGPKEDDLSQIEINFADSIKSGEYNPRAESSSQWNKDLWKKLSTYFGVEDLATGTLIEIKMEKRKFKELYRKIISTEISVSGNILFEMGIINQSILKNQEHQITIHLQHLTKDNEPNIEICEPVHHEDCEDDKSTCSSEDVSVAENSSTPSCDVMFDENIWDVECSEEYMDTLRIPSINLLDKAEEKQDHICFVFENKSGDKKFLLQKDATTFMEITPDNLRNLAKKIKMYTEQTIEELSVKLNCKFKDAFVISLAHHEDWITALQDELVGIIKIIPSLKSSAHAQLLSHIKGHYYFREGICALNSRLKASHTQGGDRSQRKFEENIIACINYSSLLDKEFGVTVKKYSSIEEIVDPGILTIIYYLKKRWATDYNNNLKKQKEAAALEAHRLKQQQEAAKAKALEDAAKAKALEDAAKAKALEDAAKAKVLEDAADSDDDEFEEDQSDTSSNSGSSRSSRSSRSSQSESEIKEPKQIQRSSSSSILVKKGELMHYLDDWLDENVHIQELENMINFMCKSYELYKPSVADMVLAVLNLEQKIQQLLAEINTKYTSDKDPVLCGSDFYRSYKEYIKK